MGKYGWIIRGLALGAVSGLMACERVSPELPELDYPTDVTCGAADLQGLVGQNLALSNASQLPQPTRIIGPGMAVTMDYSAGRLNVEYDASDIITRVSCG